VESGDIPILIGTHSLIQKTVQFKNLAYVIIDEQHRFGVNQRASLVRRNVAEDTLKNAEKKHPEEKVRGPLSDDTLLYKDLTYRIREAMFRVVKTLGLGHKELIYQRALEEEFLRCKLSFNREKQIPITYNKKKIGTYIPDFVVEDKVILELKSIPFIGDKEKKQTWSYLKNSDYKLALLANFGSSKLDIKRFVYDTARNVSASYPHNSAFLPHFLSMTATPIPRTLALTIYGDLDLTVVDQMPSGRKPIITEIVLPNKREETYEHIRKEIKAGRQCYVICPRIDEPDPMKESAVIAKSVTEETQRLKRDIFPEYNIAGLHGKMSADEKEEIMDEFEQGKIHILVATSVIEVGVNVPNSTMIVIEGAERFGLAQLHQLRGRVIRSNHQAYCFVFAEGKSAKTVQRLKAFKTAKNGFELAEYDLQLRGAGELSGGKQWGISDVGMEALKNIKMVEAARNEALAIITKDENLNNYPLLQEVIGHRKSKEIHFE
jgi:GxxExxY protein